mmetsp:Transcript_11751/g.49291  ORF Transcript_11751/g.49291 Transcript_11751/m.49291 type:complete len:212 (-) Transcript_11751:2763-3398(-)
MTSRRRSPRPRSRRGTSTRPGRSTGRSRRGHPCSFSASATSPLSIRCTSTAWRGSSRSSSAASRRRINRRRWRTRRRAPSSRRTTSRPASRFSTSTLPTRCTTTYADRCLRGTSSCSRCCSAWPSCSSGARSTRRSGASYSPVPPTPTSPRRTPPPSGSPRRSGSSWSTRPTCPPLPDSPTPSPRAWTTTENTLRAARRTVSLWTTPSTES